MQYNTQNAASLLGISPKVLLSWSEHLAPVLSDSANDTRAYTEADIALLQRAKSLLSSGYSYEQVRSELSPQQPLRPTKPHARGDTGTSPAEDAAPTARETGTRPPVPSQQPPRQPIDQLRDHLRRPETTHEPVYLTERSWSERFSHGLWRWLAIVLGVCLSAILVGTGIVFLTGQPVFSDVGRNSSIPTTALTQVASGDGGAMPIQTPAPTRSPTALEPNAAAPSSQAPQDAPISPSSLAIVPTAAALQAAATTLQPHATVEASAEAWSVAPSASPPAPSAAILQRVAAAEAALYSGQFEATIDHGGENRSSAQVRFDIGSGQRPPAFQITSTYEGSSGVQTIERITIGDRSWQRQPDGSWTEQAAQEGVIDQISVFLPHTDAVTEAEVATEPNITVLHWYDPGRDVDVTLSIDPSTGTPLELRELTRLTGVTLTVSYESWNTAVEITPPK